MYIDGINEQALLALADLKAYASYLEQALRAEFERLSGQIDTSLEALEGRLLAFENQTNTRLEALEAKFALLSPQDPPGEQLKLPKRPQDAPRASASARPGRAAAPELTPIPGTSKPRPGTPPVQPRWADIAAGEQSGWKTVNNKRRAAEKALKGAQSSSVRPGDLKPAKGEHKEDRRLIFRRSDPKVSPKAPREDVILTLNRFLTQAGFPSFMRIVDANYTETGALSALLNRGALAEKLVSTHRDPLLAACRQADSTVIAVELNEQWHRVKVHGVSVD
ncbi:hypothetical protein ACJ73_09422, partial [Blastomyces percursus]